MDNATDQETVDITIPPEPQAPVEEVIETPIVPPQELQESLIGQDSLHEPTEEGTKKEPSVWTSDSCPTSDCEHYKAWIKEQGYEPVTGHNVTKPCDYCNNKEKYQKIADDYYEDCKLKNKPPYIQEMAILMGHHRETMRNWLNEEEFHPELVATGKVISTLQELWLLKRTIGRYNPTGAIFQLKVNHGAVETEKKVLAGDKNEPIQVEIIEESNPFKNEE